MMQQVLIKKFTMIRKKGLLLILVIPYMFMLRKYFAVARTRALIHVTTKGTTRGFFSFYGQKQKQWMYVTGYKTWMYSDKVRPDFKGTFKNWTDKYLDVQAVEDKKDQAMESVGNETNGWKLTNKQVEFVMHMEKTTSNPYSREMETSDNRNFDYFRKKVRDFKL